MDVRGGFVYQSVETTGILMLCRDANMLNRVRTTIRIDDALYRQVKTQAAQTGRTVSEVIEDAVRTSLGSRSERQHRRRKKLPVSGGSGLMPGIDIADSRALRDLMDEGLGLDELR